MKTEKTTETIWIYEPVAQPRTANVSLSPRLNSLEGKVVGLLDNAFWNSSNIVVERLTELMTERHQAQLITGKTVRWLSHDASNVGKVTDEVVDDMVANCDAAIVMLGN